MFIGHNAVGFASKKLAPHASLYVLMGAPMLLDLLWPIFLLLGIEHVKIHPGDTRLTPLEFTDYPWSHSLLMAIVWSVVAGGGYLAWTRYVRGAVVVAFGVVSHWVLDFITHRPDLPLYPGGPKVGLGLWNAPVAAIAIEAAMFAIAVSMYRSVTTALDRIGVVAFFLFTSFLVVAYVGNMTGKTPPNVTALAWFAMAAWLLPLWAGWFDKHRAVVVDEEDAEP